MIQFKLIGGFDRFIVLNKQMAQKIYGDNNRLIDQLKTMFPTDLSEELYRKHGNSVISYSTVAGKYNIRGAIYDWNGLIAVLPFDFTSVIPYAVSYNCGKSFIKKFNKDVIERALSSIDVEYRYGHLYKHVMKAIKGYNLDGEITGFSKVQKHNGKFNYIDIQTGEEVSPIDFDSCTLINPDNGMFRIEYGGRDIDACLDGFYDELGGEHTFDELPTYVENLNNQTAFFNGMDDFDNF